MCENPILHVLVVGFHHKKGCQVEYSYPALLSNETNDCPDGWKYLPTLALPDGSHNFQNDTAYFHLSSLTDPKKTVYGISCYRQISAQNLKIKTDDVTRSTVQKAVCVLSTVPLYGHIQVKMSLITHAYFEEGDFSKVSLLEDTYHHLNSCLTQSQIPPQIFVGLSARDLILQWRHKALLLFKLLLLEKKIIFYKSPVQPLCTTILTLLSLHPQMIESGLDQSACVKLSRPMSPMPDFVETSNVITTKEITEDETNQSTNSTVLPEMDEDTSKVLGDEEKPTLQRDVSLDTLTDVTAQMGSIATHVSASECGAPLQLFTEGYLCYPYLSLPYMDLLMDGNVRGYVVGATNVLFKQKRQLADVLIEIDGTRIECQDLELRRQLHLTTEDLRFADFLVKHVSEERHDVFLDGVGWEGGDEWIRAQFKVYLLCLLRTSLLPENSRELEHFNSSFITAWKDTHNYKSWASEPNKILELNPGHPFAGQLSVADMKLRLTHTMQNTESGRKINQAMVSTGRAVATTGRAVGGAISQAKGALTNWWSHLTTVENEENVNEVEKDLELFEKMSDEIPDNKDLYKPGEINIA